MKKLLKLKQWLTVADAAHHLGILFGEDVSEADVLRLEGDDRRREFVQERLHNPRSDHLGQRTSGDEPGRLPLAT